MKSGVTVFAFGGSNASSAGQNAPTPDQPTQKPFLVNQQSSITQAPGMILIKLKYYARNGVRFSDYPKFSRLPESQWKKIEKAWIFRRHFKQENELHFSRSILVQPT